ncbi:DUF3606 domain-containing protein [Pedobacter agri]|uniref:DUF3606 domain-containing protein n=1 Tax=Pedobacter agri TaxID=454586 RepID=UPI0039776374
MNNTFHQIDEKPEIIEVSEEKDCRYWTTRLGVTTEVLKSAIRATRCVTLKDIARYFDQHNIKHLSTHR